MKTASGFIRKVGLNIKNKLLGMNKKQRAILVFLIIFMSLAVMVANTRYYVKRQFDRIVKTNIEVHTPVISRTDLHKKPNIQIEIYDDIKSNDLANSDTKVAELVSPEEGVQDSVEKTEVEKSADLEGIKLLEQEVASLKTKVAELEDLSKKDLSEIKDKISKLEDLNGNVGKMANIFLSQQLVLLDTAFKEGGDQNIAIEHVLSFAKNVAKNEAVSSKLEELLNMTKQNAIITTKALIFYADQLQNITVEKSKKEEESEPDTIIGKLKRILKSFIRIEKKEEVNADVLYWKDSIRSVQESLVFADYVTASKLLEDEKLVELGGEDFENFVSLFDTFIEQQKAFQSVMGAFIEGYNYDY